MKNNWYVYAHYINKKEVPFYIGIGLTKDRASSLKNRNKYWHGVVMLNKGFTCKILFKGLTNEQACDKEKELIKMYGRSDLNSGKLVNLTSGGQGNSSPSKETRFKIGSARRGCKVSDASKLKMSKARMGKVPWNKGLPQTEEVKRKISLTLKSKVIFISEETRKKLSAASTGRRHTDASKLKMSLNMIGNNKGKRLNKI